MHKQQYANIKEMIIRQDERLKDKLPKYFKEKISEHLKGKDNVDDMTLEGIIGFNYTRLKSF